MATNLIYIRTKWAAQKIYSEKTAINITHISVNVKTTHAISATTEMTLHYQQCYTKSSVSMYTVSPKKHVTTFSTITLTISVRLQ